MIASWLLLLMLNRIYIQFYTKMKTNLISTTTSINYDRPTSHLYVSFLTNIIIK